MPGVRLVMTADDLPQPVPRYGPQYQDRPVLAVGETKFHGEPVAAVAADTKDAAEEAARLVEVEYEELPGVYRWPRRWPRRHRWCASRSCGPRTTRSARATS